MVNCRIEKCGLNPVIGDIVLVENAPIILDENNVMDFKMENVVLPLPGIDMIYPEALKQDYIDFMKTEDLDPNEMGRKQK